MTGTINEVRDGATVCGAIANILRTTDPADPGYDMARRCYGAALDAAGLAKHSGASFEEFAVRWQRGTEPAPIDPDSNEGLMRGLASYQDAETEGRKRRVAPGGVRAFQIFRRTRYVGPWEQVGDVVIDQ